MKYSFRMIQQILATILFSARPRFEEQESFAVEDKELAPMGREQNTIIQLVFDCYTIFTINST